MAMVLFLLMVFRIPVSESVPRSPHEPTALALKHEQWMADFGRTYQDGAQKLRRFEIFKDNLKYIESFSNARNRSYTLGLNQFADLTHEEFLASRTGLIRFSTNLEAVPKNSSRYQEPTEVPTSLDWRQEGAVTPVKDQLSCRCCWAFSSVAAMEGIVKIKTGELVSLSEQQLVDCSTNNHGCDGGWNVEAFRYITENSLTTEDNYPYKAENGTCDTNKTTSSQDFKISGYENVPPNDEGALLRAVATQPVSIAIDTRGKNFQFYKGGVLQGDCGNDLNHEMTIVGFSADDDKDGTKYWLVKNSWGEGWGESGYMRIHRDVKAPEGLCGLAMQAYYPVIA